MNLPRFVQVNKTETIGININLAEIHWNHPELFGLDVNERKTQMPWV
jgi:hypothetical protein